jgi:hypothetical protein
MDSIILALETKYDEFRKLLNEPHPIVVNEKPIFIETTFKLPICYVDPSYVFSLSNTVSSDLELINENDSGMYNHLFKPKHVFAKQMIHNWKKSYTTHPEFLEDTQKIVKSMSSYSNSTNYKMDCDKILNIWKDIKLDETFLERYNYMDWDMLLHLNHSQSFLQTISFVNICSPAVSLVLPILFLIFPFILLKIQGVPITISVYLDVLKNIARNHFIGKALLNMTDLSWDKIVYIVFMLAMYLLQIYQNIAVVQRFYKNIKKINDQLIELRNYIDYSIDNMDSFLGMSYDKLSYENFNKEVLENISTLERLRKTLGSVSEFTPSLTKLNSLGTLLKCYYELHSNSEYEYAIKYSVGFEGYLNNLLGVYENYSNGVVNFTALCDSSSNKCEFIDQYYPPLLSENPVKNNCNFDKNIIISAPNKSGKTTILKTTTINIIFSQQTGFGFHKSAMLTPYTHIHSYLNIPDTSGRDSLFQAESRRCKEIIDIIHECNDALKFRHFCIFDELYSGTNPEEASKAGYAFLKYLSKYANVNFILTTHYLSICKKYRNATSIQNYKMDVRVLENGEFVYTYKIKKGISKIKGGVRVLKDMDYPKEIIDSIENY